MGLDRFYEGKKRDGFLSLIGWALIFFSLILLAPCHGYDYGVEEKAIASMSISPLIVLPFCLGIYGFGLLLRKGFRMLRQFESAE